MLRKLGISLLIGLLLLNLQTFSYAEDSNTTGPKIHVYVRDSYLLPYNNVLVQVWNTSLVDSGYTVRGNWTSIPLTANSTYLVIVSSPEDTDSSEVYVSMIDVFLSFELRVTIGGGPSIAISEIVIEPINPRPGTDAALRVSIENIGNDTAYDIAVTLSGEGDGFINTFAFLGTLEKWAETEAKFGMNIPPRSAYGERSINISVNYRDRVNKLYTTGQKYQYTVFPIEPPDVKIGQISLEPLPLVPDSTAILSIQLLNIGSDRATDVAVTISGDVGSFSSSFNYVGELEEKTTRTVQFSLKLDRTAIPGTFVFTITVEYQDSFGNSYAESQPYEYRVYSAGAPEVKIDEIALVPQMLVPSSEANLRISLINIGTAPARDISVTLSGWTEGFSTTFTYIGTMTPSSLTDEGRTVVTFGLRIPYNMSAGKYRFDVALSYMDVYGNRYTEEYPYEFTVFPLGTPEVKIMTMLTQPLRLTQGVNGTIVFHLTNVGDGIAKDIVVKVTSSTAALATASGYVGRLEPDQNATAAFSINVPRTTKPGTNSLNVTLSYRDFSGVQYSETGPFVFDIFAVEVFKPIIKVQNILYDPNKLTLGTDGMATVFLVNTGDTAAKDITVRISGGRYSQKALSSTNPRSNDILSTNTFTVGSIDPGKTATVILGLSVDSDAVVGTYLLRFAMTYKDSSNQTYQDSTFIEAQVFPISTLFTTSSMTVILVVVVISVVSLIAFLRARRPV